MKYWFIIGNIGKVGFRFNYRAKRLWGPKWQWADSRGERSSLSWNFHHSSALWPRGDLAISRKIRLPIPEAPLLYCTKHKEKQQSEINSRKGPNYNNQNKE